MRAQFTALQLLEVCPCLVARGDTCFGRRSTSASKSRLCAVLSENTPGRRAASWDTGLVNTGGPALSKPGAGRGQSTGMHSRIRKCSYIVTARRSMSACSMLSGLREPAAAGEEACRTRVDAPRELQPSGVTPRQKAHRKCYSSCRARIARLTQPSALLWCLLATGRSPVSVRAGNECQLLSKKNYRTWADNRFP